MDVNVCWRDLVDAVNREDYEEADAQASVLLIWLEKKGFPPQIVGPNDTHHKANYRIAQTFARAMESR